VSLRACLYLYNSPLLTPRGAQLYPKSLTGGPAMKKSLVVGALALIFVRGHAPFWIAAWAAEKSNSPTILSCTFNAYAQRGYGFEEKAWRGNLLGTYKASNPPFDVTGKGAATMGSDVFMELIFSGLDTDAPRVRELKPKSIEYQASVLIRTADSVILLWRNKPGWADWAWLATIDHQRRVAVVVSVYSGSTLINGGLETMDCR